MPREGGKLACRPELPISLGMMQATKPLILTTCLLLVILIGGCASTTNEITDPFYEGTGAWPYWPTSMRLHPLSRLVFTEGDEENCTLEARVEFSDRDQNISKVAGKIKLTLFDQDASGLVGEFIESWDINLEDLDENRRHFDDITRTYLFRLKLLKSKLRKRMELVAICNTADGKRFNASIALSLD